MTTLREDLLWLAVIFAGVVAIIVVGLSAIMLPREQAEIDFRAACAAAKGNTVWNGRHWECLK